MGGSSSAADAANASNNAQNAQIQQAVSSITNAYGSPQRQGQYATYGKNLNDYYTGQVNQQQAVNARDLKFADARSGLTGGSAAADGNTQLQKDYTTGLLQASQQAQAGQAALEQSDANSKNQLISLAQAGNMTGSQAGQIASAQNASLGAAQNFGGANALGNLFSSTSGIYNNEQTAAAARKAQTSPIGSLYG